MEYIRTIKIFEICIRITALLSLMTESVRRKITMLRKTMRGRSKATNSDCAFSHASRAFEIMPCRTEGHFDRAEVDRLQLRKSRSKTKSAALCFRQNQKKKQEVDAWKRMIRAARSLTCIFTQPTRPHRRRLQTSTAHCSEAISG